MHKLWGKKQVLTGLIILLFISLIYAANSNNQIAVVIPALILAFLMILDTIWTISTREYKTTYWIVLMNIINILCNFSLVALFTRSNSFSNVDQIFDYALIRDALGLGLLLSLLASSILSSRLYKISKGAEGHEPRDM